jgi:hypothetical protein
VLSGAANNFGNGYTRIHIIIMPECRKEKPFS